MEWVEGEPLWLVCPGFADEFVWCEAFEGLEAFGEVVGLDEVSEVVAELVVGVVVEPPDGSVLDGAVRAFDLAIGPRMLWLGQPVIDVGEGTGVFESVSSEGLLARDHLADLGWGPGFALGIGEVDAVVGQHRMDLVGYRLDEGAQEVGCGARGCFDVQRSEGELAGAVDGDEEVELAFGGLHFGDVDMEEADGIGFESLPDRLVSLDLGESTDAMALKTAMQ